MYVFIQICMIVWVRKKESIYEQLQPYVEVMIACGSLKIYEQGFYVNTSIRINVCMGCTILCLRLLDSVQGLVLLLLCLQLIQPLFQVNCHPVFGHFQAVASLDVTVHSVLYDNHRNRLYSSGRHTYVHAMWITIDNSSWLIVYIHYEWIE